MVEEARRAPAGRFVTDRARYWRAALIGAAIAFVLFMVMLLTSGVNLRGTSWTSPFYAAQATAWWHGRWSIPQEILGIEGFKHGGRWFMYYGPFPALLRVPFVLIFPKLGEQLTQVSMVLAWIVAVLATIDLGWRVRSIARPGAALRTAEYWVTGVGVVVVGAGSVLMFLASQAWIYHEAELWGCALAIAAFDAIVAYLVRRRPRTLVLASVIATCAVCSRASVGLGPIAAIGLLGAAAILPATARWFGVPEPRRGRLRLVGGLLAAAIVPVVIYAFTNYSKFGTLFVFPTDQQLMSILNPQRRKFLAESGGSYFGLQFIPTTLVAYLRPFGFGWRSLLPWGTFGSGPSALGGATFDVIEPTASLPASMPLLTALGITGFVAAFWPRRSGGRLAPMRAPLIGTIVGAASIFPFGYIAQRYLSDLFPVVVVGGLVGLHLLFGWSERRMSSRRAVRLVWFGAAALGAFSLFANIGIAIDYHWLSPWTPEQQVADLVHVQYSLHAKLPGGSAPYVTHVDELPFPPAPRGSVYVVGDCVGAYWSAGDQRSLAWTPWQGVARTSAAGEYRLRVTIPAVTESRAEPLVVRGEAGSYQTIAALFDPHGRTRFGFASEGHDDLPHGPLAPGGFFTGEVLHLRPGATYDLEVVMDPYSGQVRVDLNGRPAFRFYQFELTPEQLLRYVFPTDQVAFGHNPGGAPTTDAYTGRLTVLKVPKPALCADLQR